MVVPDGDPRGAGVSGQEACIGPVLTKALAVVGDGRQFPAENFAANCSTDVY